MNLIKINFIIICFISFCSTRSLHRPKSDAQPYIIIWQGDNPNKKYTFRSSQLRSLPLKMFEKDYFFEKFIPDKINLPNNNEIAFDGKKIKTLIEGLLIEINNLKNVPKNFQDFKILKRADFNHALKTGLLVLKFKEYPFILKLFIENAVSISKLESKSFNQRGIFTMGGCLRHFLGFTRIKNLENIKNKLENSIWKNKICLPRKWFWVPDKCDYLNIELYNLVKDREFVSMPSIYAILCDAIALADKRPTDQECLELSTFLEYNIDPHCVNFLYEKGTNKIAIIDTEHFPTMVGKTEKIAYACNYFDWYLNLTGYYLKIKIFSFKDERLARQRDSKSYYSL